MEAVEFNEPCTATTVENSSYHYFWSEKQGSGRTWESYRPSNRLVLTAGEKTDWSQLKSGGDVMIYVSARNPGAYAASSSLSRDYISAGVAHLSNTSQTRFKIALGTTTEDSDDVDVDMMDFVARAKPTQKFKIRAKIKLAQSRIPKVTFDEDLF